MYKSKLAPLAVGLAMLLSIVHPEARADGDCTVRAATAAEQRSYSEAYALFLRVAPKAPDGWAATDNPRTDTVPALCSGPGAAPMRRHFSRSFHLESGQQERQDKAMQAYGAQMKDQQAKAAANQAESARIDAQIAVLMSKAQKAGAAQKIAEVEAVNLEMDALMKRKTALMGYDDAAAQAARIEAEASRDTEAQFSLRFEAPRGASRTGQPYKAAAGKAFLNAYEVKGNPTHDVRVYFDGTAQPATVQVVGDPARVRDLLDATDLKAMAAIH